MKRLDDFLILLGIFLVAGSVFMNATFDKNIDVDTMVLWVTYIVVIAIWQRTRNNKARDNEIRN